MVRIITRRKSSIGKKITKKRTTKSKENIANVVFSGYTEEQLSAIRERAYYIWERKGSPDNSDYENWLDAEAELKKEGII